MFTTFDVFPYQISWFAGYLHSTENYKQLHPAAMLLLYIPQRGYQNRSFIFFEDLLPNIKFSGASVACTAMLLLLIAGN
jgi:hypothetical protein